tara:strand:- start:499 stop:810 length:312 start_codon:yes stop_codon:yes gene_type:complete
MTKKSLKEFRTHLHEASASKTNLQYLRAKTARNDHFETRRYIASEILKDRKLADAYKALEMVHNDFSSVIGNDAITIRQRLEKTLKDQLRRKVSNWDEVWSEL